MPLNRTEKYLINQGFQDTFWGKRLIELSKDDSNHDKYTDDSGDWTTCVCGKQDERIQRDSSGRPLDAILSSLGEKFHYKLWDRQYFKAAKALADIEERAAVLIREIENAQD